MVIVEKQKNFTLNTVPTRKQLFLYPANMLYDSAGHAKGCSQTGYPNRMH
jgi:hypothetical protein